MIAIAFLVMGVSQVVLGVAHEEHTVEKVFDAAGIATIEVHNSAGSVRIVGTGTETIKVTAQVSDGLRATGHEQRVEDDRLLLEASCPFLSEFCGVRYVVEAPAGVDLHVRSEGRITVSNIEGDVDLESVHGRIEAAALDGSARLHSNHGSVTATDLASAVIDASASHGDVSVELGEAPRRVQAASTHGDVKVVVPEDGTVYDVGGSSSGHGLLSTPISTDPDSDRPIVATSGHGDVTIHYGR